MNGNCLLFVGMLIVLGMCRELSSADGPAQAPPAAKLIVENAVRKVKQHVRIYEEARNKTLEDAKSRLSDEVARLGEQKKTEEVLAVSQIIKTLALTVEQLAKVPIHLATTGPPSMKEWVIGRWTGERTPHTFSFIERGKFEGTPKNAQAMLWRGVWKNERDGFIDVEVANGGRWEVRRCGPNAMAVLVFNAAGIQQDDGFVLLRVLDPVAGIWKWHDGSIREMWGDGQVKDRPGARWRATNPSAREYSFSWGNGVVIDVLTLSADGRTLRGKNQSGVDLTAKRVD
jgi:hypothetical protein